MFSFQGHTNYSSNKAEAIKVSYCPKTIFTVFLHEVCNCITGLKLPTPRRLHAMKVKFTLQEDPV